MQDLIIFILLGVFVGVLTGLLPGLHPNNVTALLISFLPLLLCYLTPLQLLTFAVSLFVTHSFTSFVASVVFGIPEEANALSVLPSHRMVLNGKGYEAVYLTVLGGVLSVICTVTILPILLKTFRLLYVLIIRYLLIFLVVFLAYSILSQNNRLRAVFITALSGLFGYIVLNIYYLKSYEKLTAMFSGMFGASFIVVSLFTKSRIPEQNFDIGVDRLYIKESLLGTFGAIFTSLFPSLSPSQSIAIIQRLFRVKGTEEFLVMVGALTTADVVVSLVALYTFGNPRSGLSAFLQFLFSSLRFETLMFLIGVVLISLSLSSVVTMLIAKSVMKIIQKISYIYLNILVLIILVFIIYVFSGYVGVVIFITSVCLGVVTILLDVNVSLLVSVLMIPLIMNLLF